MRKLYTIVLLFILASCSEFQQITKSEDLDAKYEAAVNYYEKEDYYRAGLLLEELIPLFRGKTEAELTQYYYAYCHYHQDQLYLASYYFDAFTKTFPRSDKVEECAFMNIKTLYLQTPKPNLEQSTTYEALNAIQNFVNTYPRSVRIPECNVMVDELNAKLEQKAYDNSKIYYQLRYYKAAIIALDNFLKSFPASQYADEMTFLKVDAQYQLAKVSVESMQKERYLETIDLYREYIDQFPNGQKTREAEMVYDQALSFLEKLGKTEKQKNFY